MVLVAKGEDLGEEPSGSRTASSQVALIESGRKETVPDAREIGELLMGVVVAWLAYLEFFF